jgi:hypothetical protein
LPPVPGAISIDVLRARRAFPARRQHLTRSFRFQR